MAKGIYTIVTLDDIKVAKKLENNSVFIEHSGSWATHFIQEGLISRNDWFESRDLPPMIGLEVELTSTNNIYVNLLYSPESENEIKNWVYPYSVFVSPIDFLSELENIERRVH